MYDTNTIKIFVEINLFIFVFCLMFMANLVLLYKYF